MLKLGISQRLLFVLFVTAVLPYLSISLYWYSSTLSALRDEASHQQALLNDRTTDHVNQYLTDKVNALIIHSQAPSVQNLSATTATADLTSLMKQDSDISQLVLANASGKEVAVLNQSGPQPARNNISQNDSFRVTTFLGGKEYISPVAIDANHQPSIVIAVPLVNYDNRQSLTALSTDESGIIRSKDAIKGVLLATVSLKNLYLSVISAQVPGSYSYIVDGQGMLIGYPTTNAYDTTPHDMSNTEPVAAFLADQTAGPSGQIMQSERGVEVMSSHGQVARTGWGVITEESVNGIFGTANHTAIIGVWLFVVITIATLVLTSLFSRHLLIPIRTLVRGAQQLSQGDLSTRIPVSPDEEIGVLGVAFNSMADSLESNIKEARAQASKVNVILNNIGEGIIAVDADGNIVLANIAASIFIGVVPKGIIGKPLKDHYKWSQKGKELELNLREIHVYEEVTLTNADRRERFVDLLVNPIANDPSGIKAIVTIIDKTNERDLENMKIDFVSMAAHELRTPMTAIRGYLDLIWHDPLEQLPDQTQNYLQHIQSSSSQLVGLINNLLNVSRIERGALTLKKDKQDWAKLVQACISDSQFLARTKGITLRYIGPSDSVFIFADQLAITEVINNLVSNAIRYTLENGHVTVMLKEENGHVITSIADDGIGIKPENLEHLFTRFYRVHDELTTGIGGTGLGLYISKSIAELHKGTIEVTSQVGEGSTFTVILPSFNEVEYNEMVKSSPLTLNSKHGWFTKNTARRR